MIEFDEGEVMQFEIRKHPFVIVVTAIYLSLAVIFPLILMGIFAALSVLTPEVIVASTPFALFLYFIWLLGIWIFFFLEWTDYYLDVWHVTDRRVIDIEQKGIFHREVINLRFDTIQDVTVETRGFLATMFDFGDIQIQTAGAERRIVLRHAAHPEAFKEKILDLHHSALTKPKEVRVVSEA